MAFVTPGAVTTSESISFYTLFYTVMQKGQLGHGDRNNRKDPTVLEGMLEYEVIQGSCAKTHTALTTEEGESFTFGSNHMGQCGVGKEKTKPTDKLVPVKAIVPPCTAVLCGNDFTIWLCEGKLYASGSPQHGVLGDGSTHEYNAADCTFIL